MKAQAELGAFLRARRDSRRPADLGLDHDAGRRVPGLRREEVARRAGLSVDYLRRLEQGRALPSDAVLDSLADAFGLQAAERAHLDLLADRARGRPAAAPLERVERPSLLGVVEAASPAPAVVLGRRLDVLAWNPTGAALDPAVAAKPPPERNVARRVLLDPGARDLYPEWDELADEVADVLRLNAARFPDDDRLAALVDDLHEGSEAFRRRWRQNEVFEKTFGRKIVDHPDVGRLELCYEAFPLPDAPGQTLIIYTAEPETPTATRLRRLASLATSRGYALEAREA